MSMSQSLFSAISGLINHQFRLDNVGNNLANINTVGYKRNVLRFQDILSQTIRGGMAPDSNRGGINPLQLGLGVQTGSVLADFGQGGLETTGRLSDLAIEGDGFFKVVAGGMVRYTRDGSFTLGQTGELLNVNGFRVHGWNADVNGLIDTSGSTEAVIIPLGEMRIAQETGNVYYNGNLNAAGSLASQYGELETHVLDNGAGGTVTAGTALASVRYDDGSGFQPLFTGLNAGDIITVSAVKGNRTITENITYTAGMTLGAFTTQLDQLLGIQTIAGGGVDAGSQALVDAVASTLVVRSNAGELNDISRLEFTHSGTTADIFNVNQTADGESAVVTTVVYDSLGNEHLASLTMALVQRDNVSSTWRWYADCQDDTDLTLDVGTGTVVFDNEGRFLSDSGDQFRIDLDVSGVITQLVVDPDYALLTQFADALGSDLNVRSQDGSPMGVLTNYTISENGTVTGLFTNGLTRDLAKIALTRFANNNGLLRDSQNLYAEGVNSGVAQDGEALSNGRGAIRGGALESSNVDVAQEFTDLIMTQRGYQANARTISASDEMLMELMNLTR